MNWAVPRIRIVARFRMDTGDYLIRGAISAVQRIGVRSSAQMDLHVLPLAVTMMAGPQIISSIIFVTRESVVKVSLA
jgi:small neutral amino acid transporter SnatA (MarC family)